MFSAVIIITIINIVITYVWDVKAWDPVFDLALSTWSAGDFLSIERIEILCLETRLRSKASLFS